VVGRSRNRGDDHQWRRLHGLFSGGKLQCGRDLDASQSVGGQHFQWLGVGGIASRAANERHT
jgi:hypothetical protein